MVSSSLPFVFSSPPLLTERSSILISRGWSKVRAMADRCAVGEGGGGSVDISQGFQCLDGIRSIAESGRFKAWLLDQFGVLHDGKKPYPGAISTLKKLAGQGAKLVVISNSSRRACVTIEKLKSLGFDPSVFSGTITSGELTHQYLLSVDDADFILAHGTEALGQPSGESLPMDLDNLEKILVMAVKRKIPMVVANPDYVTVEARALRVMPGTLGDKYEKLGGQVKWMGKPDKMIYSAAMSMVGAEVFDCITVGDSLHHDIKGAQASGISSAFVTGGIHANELGIANFGETAASDAVHFLACKYDAYPSFVLPAFTW